MGAELGDRLTESGPGLLPLAGVSLGESVPGRPGTVLGGAHPVLPALGCACGGPGASPRCKAQEVLGTWGSATREVGYRKRLGPGWVRSCSVSSETDMIARENYGVWQGKWVVSNGWELRRRPGSA